VAGKRKDKSLWKDLNLNCLNTGWGMDWIDMAQDRDRWRALESVVMNLRVP
jgi:hypothetical protein